MGGGLRFYDYIYIVIEVIEEQKKVLQFIIKEYGKELLKLMCEIWIERKEIMDKMFVVVSEEISLM